MPAVQRADVQRALVVETQDVNLLERRIEQHERLAVRIHPQHPPGRAGADEQIARLVEGERGRVRGVGLVERRAFAVRRDLVDDALLAGAGKDVALRVDGQRPDVLVVRIEERRRRAVCDRPCRSCRPATCATYSPPFGRRRQRMHFELRAVEEDRALVPRSRCGRPCLRCRCRRTASRRFPASIDQRNGAAVS